MHAGLHSARCEHACVERSTCSRFKIPGIMIIPGLKSLIERQIVNAAKHRCGAAEPEMYAALHLLGYLLLHDKQPSNTVPLHTLYLSTHCSRNSVQPNFLSSNILWQQHVNNLSCSFQLELMMLYFPYTSRWNQQNGITAFLYLLEL